MKFKTQKAVISPVINAFGPSSYLGICALICFPNFTAWLCFFSSSSRVSFLCSAQSPTRSKEAGSLKVQQSSILEASQHESFLDAWS